MTLKSDDLVFNTDKNGVITAGGFSVNSCLLKSGVSPITTINNGSKKGGGSVSAIFNNLAVPAGLLYMQQSLATHSGLFLSQSAPIGRQTSLESY